MTIIFPNKVNLIYSDMIYEDEDLSWMNYYWNEVLEDNGIFIVQTDFHTNYLVRFQFEKILKGNFINHLVWKNEWGNHPKNKMHQCYDDILVYSKGKNYKFYPDRIQIPKATNNKGLNPSGRITKTATAWIDDICLTTTSKERIMKEDGHLIRWQKPIRLFDRILAPFTDENDWIVENFGGTFPAVRWSILNNRNSIGIEYDKETFEIGKKEVEKLKV